MKRLGKVVLLALTLVVLALIFPRTMAALVVLELLVLGSAYQDWLDARSKHVVTWKRTWLWAHWTVLRRTVARLQLSASLLKAVFDHASRWLTPAQPQPVMAVAAEPRDAVVVPMRKRVAA